MPKVKIKILPGHGIGGVGSAGHEAWMEEEEAKMYQAEGYLEILEEGKPVKAEIPTPEEPEDHKVMKPQPRRRKA